MNKDKSLATTTETLPLQSLGEVVSAITNTNNAEKVKPREDKLDAILGRMAMVLEVMGPRR